MSHIKTDTLTTIVAESDRYVLIVAPTATDLRRHYGYKDWMVTLRDKVNPLNTGWRDYDTETEALSVAETIKGTSNDL